MDGCILAGLIGLIVLVCIVFFVPLYMAALADLGEAKETWPECYGKP